MKLYKPIELDHPYLNDPETLEAENDRSLPPGLAMIQKLYQPCRGKWPLYSLTVWKVETPQYHADGETGIVVTSSIKRDMKSWWTACDNIQPLPNSLVLVFGTMILAAYEDPK